MQRNKHGQLAHLRDAGVVDQHQFDEACAAVHDAATDRAHVRLVRMQLHRHIGFGLFMCRGPAAPQTDAGKSEQIAPFFSAKT